MWKTACSQVDFLLNGKAVDELTMICHTSRARDTAKRVCEKLQESIPRQQFGIIIQGAVGSKILAREDIRPYRKDVTAKCVRNLLLDRKSVCGLNGNLWLVCLWLEWKCLWLEWKSVCGLSVANCKSVSCVFVA